MILIDTSAFLALLDKNDAFHQRATKEWATLLYEGNSCVTNNYVLLESIAIIQRRLGVKAVQELSENVLPHIQVDWIDEFKHENDFGSLLSANRRNLSLVDISAFATMRRLGISKVFTFDHHFAEEGFEVLG